MLHDTLWSTTNFLLLLLRRSTSGLGKGDGINNHTDKWLYVSSHATAVQRMQTPLPQAWVVRWPVPYAHKHTRHADARAVLLLCRSNTHTQGDIKSPLEYIQETEPIKVSGPVVASYGSE